MFRWLINIILVSIPVLAKADFPVFTLGAADKFDSLAVAEDKELYPPMDHDLREYRERVNNILAKFESFNYLGFLKDKKKRNTPWYIHVMDRPFRDSIISVYTRYDIKSFTGEIILNRNGCDAFITRSYLQGKTWLYNAFTKFTLPPDPSSIYSWSGDYIIAYPDSSVIWIDFNINYFRNPDVCTIRPRPDNISFDDYNKKEKYIYKRQKYFQKWIYDNIGYPLCLQPREFSNLLEWTWNAHVNAILQFYGKPAHLPEVDKRKKIFLYRDGFAYIIAYNLTDEQFEYYSDLFQNRFIIVAQESFR